MQYSGSWLYDVLYLSYSCWILSARWTQFVLCSNIFLTWSSSQCRFRNFQKHCWRLEQLLLMHSCLLLHWVYSCILRWWYSICVMLHFIVINQLRDHFFNAKSQHKLLKTIEDTINIVCLNWVHMFGTGSILSFQILVFSTLSTVHCMWLLCRNWLKSGRRILTRGTELLHSVLSIGFCHCHVDCCFSVASRSVDNVCNNMWWSHWLALYYMVYWTRHIVCMWGWEIASVTVGWAESRGAGLIWFKVTCRGKKFQILMFVLKALFNLVPVGLSDHLIVFHLLTVKPIVSWMTLDVKKYEWKWSWCKG